MKDHGKESEQAYDILKQRNEYWKETCEFKKGVTVKFIAGVEAGKYEGRTFKCRSNPKFTALFCGCIRLAGLYGYHDLSTLEVVE